MKKAIPVIDGDTGTVIEASDYYPFGKRIQVTAPVSEPVEGSQHAAEPGCTTRPSPAEPLPTRCPRTTTA